MFLDKTVKLNRQNLKDILLVDCLYAVLAHLHMVSVTTKVAELLYMLGYHGVFCSV